MPSAGLSFDFDTEEPSAYMGIDVKYGGFTNKEEYLSDDYIRKDDLEIHKNELLTGGFERNGLAFSNILNLEFMFDDTTGEKYIEEFHTAESKLDLKRFDEVDVIMHSDSAGLDIKKFLNDFENIRSNSGSSVDDLITLISTYVPEFEHKKSQKSLNDRM